jgi:CRISPR/Cas system CSM-associated protein Csm3 (group 7 of RAMP superfamily)
MTLVHEEPHGEYYALETLNTRRIPVRQEAFHDVLRGLHGSIALCIKAKSPLFVGSGQMEYEGNQIYQRFARRGEEFIIPGTSIKGAIRSYAEALSPSCEGGRCGREGGRHVDRVCLCCSLFGTLGLQGRVSFTDAVAVQGIKPIKHKIRLRWNPKRVRKGRRFYFHDKPEEDYALAKSGGETEVVEALEAGAIFKCEMMLYNVQEWELGLLLLAMGLSPNHRFDLKLGGGKNRLLGSVRFQANDPLTLRKGKADGYHSFIGGAFPQEEIQLKKAVEAYLNWLNENRNIVENVLSHFKSVEGI